MSAGDVGWVLTFSPTLSFGPAQERDQVGRCNPDRIRHSDMAQLASLTEPVHNVRAHAKQSRHLPDRKQGRRSNRKSANGLRAIGLVTVGDGQRAQALSFGSRAAKMQQTFVERRRNRARPNHCISVSFRGKSPLAKVGDALPSFRRVFTRQGSQVQTLLRPCGKLRSLLGN